MRHRLKAPVLLPLLGVLLVACGGSRSGAPASGQAPEVGPVPEFARVVPPVEDVSDSVFRSGNCRRAHVDAGPSPGQIDFTVECAGSDERQLVTFAVARYPLRRGYVGTQGIVRVRGRPPVTGPGAVSGRGVCRFEPGRLGVSCQLRADGPARLEGTMWVRPRWRCARSVQVLVRETKSGQTCNSEQCPAFRRARTLTVGRPGGC